MQEKSFIILQNIEYYSTWKTYTISELQQQNYYQVIVRRLQLNIESVKVILIQADIVAENRWLSMLILALKKNKKDFLATLSKSIGLIKELVDKNLYPLLSNKNTGKIWIILENRFQYISSISVTRIFLDTYVVKLLDCTDVINYTSHYQIPFNKLLSLFNNKFQMSKKTLEMILQRSLLCHFGRNYTAFVSAIGINWKNKITNRANIIL